MQYNKTEYIELPDSSSVKRERWADEDLDLFWEDYKSNDFTEYILVMSCAGLRYGEMATISIPDVDLEKQVMTDGIKT